MIKCQICGKELTRLKQHIKRAHGISIQSYVKRYPNTPLVDPEFSEKMRRSSKRHNVQQYIKNTAIKPGEKRAAKSGEE